MDVVGAGPERGPVRPAFVVLAAVVVGALAVLGTMRGMDSPNTRRAAARRTPPATPTVTTGPAQGEVVEFGSTVTGPPLDPGEGLELLLAGGGTVASLRTADGTERTLTTLPGVVEKLVRLRRGFAALAGGLLVVRDGEEETRTPLPGGALVEGEDDTEFWTVTDGVAQRRDAHGHELGEPVTLPDGTLVVRGVAGGRLLAYRDELSPELFVWDLATRRVVRELGELGELHAAGPRHVLTGANCYERQCPFRVTNLVDGVTTTTPLPDEEGTPGAVALLDGGTFAFTWQVGAEHLLLVGRGGGNVPRVVTTGLPRDVRLQWLRGGRRLAILQLADGRFVVSVADARTGEVRQAGAYGAREVTLFDARRVTS